MKVVAITGASGGIGNQLVNDFKKAGYTVISLDINQPKINRSEERRVGKECRL